MLLRKVGAGSKVRPVNIAQTLSPKGLALRFAQGRAYARRWRTYVNSPGGGLKRCDLDKAPSVRLARSNYSAKNSTLLCDQ